MRIEATSVQEEREVTENARGDELDAIISMLQLPTGTFATTVCKSPEARSEPEPHNSLRGSDLTRFPTFATSGLLHEKIDFCKTWQNSKPACLGRCFVSPLPPGPAATSLDVEIGRSRTKTVCIFDAKLNTQSAMVIIRDTPSPHHFLTLFTAEVVMTFALLRMHLAVLMSAAIVPSLLFADDSTKDDTTQAAAPADGKTGEPVEVEVWAIDIHSADASSAVGPEKRDSDIPKFRNRSDVEDWIDAMRDQGHTVRSRCTRLTTTTDQATKMHFGTDEATVAAVSISAQGQTNSMVMRPIGTIINVTATLADDNQIVLAMLWERSELRESDRLLLKPTEGEPIAAMDVDTRSVSSTFIVDGNTMNTVCHDTDSNPRKTLLILASARRLEKE